MRDQEFWHSKWASNQIGFHLEDVNPLLPACWHHANPKREDKVLVPLCGKSEDLVWLATKHDSVEGVELSQIAVRSFFAEHFYTPTVTPISGMHELYQFDELSIYTGDFFTAPVSQADIVYDRAALVALPQDMREEYVARLKLLLNPGGRILLVTLNYPQEEMAGPPFSVPLEEIQQLFAGYKVTCLNVVQADEHHPKIAKKGLSRFSEEVYLIEAQ
ncbi:TPA: thiopurine S-methyltransferase [Vibrio parahaemolyticus]|uniref:thiopurine S-methyltransferase n=1 Tax=Vibrio parahaemolyticus TaxID=670 RepID=UPI00040A6FBA|nr:thiopurine S-methyltransferase [Vibrio parahaemolyticus]KIT32387.1 thiopurine S-methyltransferase [Vibrio parahaemolyticus VP766]EGR2770866.1 thiopurine S-methyltransferase [Vibrio parahaemolyticus]EGR2833532.1 thiopurine S-methyltransferase [Vibrio parahaemolyticus]EGR2886115.1 thiopurine S-methyltransferase [Vibrio parahaemolyticus]EGR2905328.1 thiopurine S-methyltransferase [Vibrio parahaemolyticus]